MKISLGLISFFVAHIMLIQESWAMLSIVEIKGAKLTRTKKTTPPVKVSTDTSFEMIGDRMTLEKRLVEIIMQLNWGDREEGRIKLDGLKASVCRNPHVLDLERDASPDTVASALERTLRDIDMDSRKSAMEMFEQDRRLRGSFERFLKDGTIDRTSSEWMTIKASMDARRLEWEHNFSKNTKSPIFCEHYGRILSAERGGLDSRGSFLIPKALTESSPSDGVTLFAGEYERLIMPIQESCATLPIVGKDAKLTRTTETTPPVKVSADPSFETIWARRALEVRPVGIIITNWGDMGPPGSVRISRALTESSPSDWAILLAASDPRRAAEAMLSESQDIERRSHILFVRKTKVSGDPMRLIRAYLMLHADRKRWQGNLRKCMEEPLFAEEYERLSARASAVAKEEPSLGE